MSQPGSDVLDCPALNCNPFAQNQSAHAFLNRLGAMPMRCARTSTEKLSLLGTWSPIPLALSRARDSYAFALTLACVCLYALNSVRAHLSLVSAYARRRLRAKPINRANQRRRRFYTIQYFCWHRICSTLYPPSMH